jgi:hypothetical protein
VIGPFFVAGEVACGHLRHRFEVLDRPAIIPRLRGSSRTMKALALLESERTGQGLARTPSLSTAGCGGTGPSTP